MGKSYTKQFKEQAMKLVTETGYEPTRAARELGMPFNTLFLWLRKAGWKKQPQPSLPVSDMNTRFPTAIGDGTYAPVLW